MPRGTSVQVDTTRLDRIIRNAEGNGEDAVRAVAFAVEAKTKEQIRVLRAIDTGAMQNSVYTRTASGAHSDGRSSSWAQIAGRIKSLRPRAQADELPIPRGKLEAYVGPSVEYAIAVHYGDARRSGRPFLENAVREVADEMARHFRRTVTDE